LHGLADSVFVAEEFPEEAVLFLEGRGHMTESLSSSVGVAVQGILVGEDGCVSAHADPRKQGTGITLNESEECGDQ
jgi:hypothetical protein